MPPVTEVPAGSPPITATDRVFRRVGDSQWLRAARLAALGASRLGYRLDRTLRLPVRNEFPHLLNQRGLLGCGVEVGVKRGEFSEQLLDLWRGRHLISVDPWCAGGEDYLDEANVTQSEHDNFHRETLGRLARFGQRSSVWRATSDAAANRLPHHCLDFVYLDARHDYESVRSDLEQWHPKLRPGGVLAGHDYVDGVFAEGVFGVKSAVDEFAAELGRGVRATYADPPWYSWYIALARA